MLLNFPTFPYCGYHGIIHIDGSLVRTRAEIEKGSHCRGLNSESLGFCLVGTDKFAKAQWDTLADVVSDCKRRWGNLVITGHRTHNEHKTCPGFDVGEWLAGGKQALQEHLLPAA